MCSGLLSLVTLVVTLAAGSPQRAPSPDEERLFADGLRAYEAGDARAAERAWKAGYAVAHDPAFLVRIGEAEEKAGAPAEAAESYRRYLHEAPDAADRADIEQRLARLAPPSAHPPPPTPGSEPAEIPGDFGAGAPHTVPAPPPPPARSAQAAPGDGSAVDREAPQTADVTGWNALRGTAWIATAAAVAALGTAAFFAASASSKEGDVNRLLSFRDENTQAPIEYGRVAVQYESAVHDGEKYARYAKIALGGAIVTAVFATSLFAVDAIRTPEARVALAPIPTSRGAGAAASLTWRF